MTDLDWQDMGLCGGCGALIPGPTQALHREWHYALLRGLRGEREQGLGRHVNTEALQAACEDVQAAVEELRRTELSAEQEAQVQAIEQAMGQMESMGGEQQQAEPGAQQTGTADTGEQQQAGATA